ncbi:MAG: hypothetical protein JJU15_01800 [Pararhodobacter sp.]|nr:hypothetical protein [Pararhodobacter sp.]
MFVVTKGGCAAAHIQHMRDRPLMKMNLQLHLVESDITGATGMRNFHTIAAGECDPEVLATFRDFRWTFAIST